MIVHSLMNDLCNDAARENSRVDQIVYRAIFLLFTNNLIKYTPVCKSVENKKVKEYSGKGK